MLLITVLLRLSFLLAIRLWENILKREQKKIHFLSQQLLEEIPVVTNWILYNFFLMCKVCRIIKSYCPWNYWIQIPKWPLVLFSCLHNITDSQLPPNPLAHFLKRMARNNLTLSDFTIHIFLITKLHFGQNGDLIILGVSLHFSSFCSSVIVYFAIKMSSFSSEKYLTS